MLEVPKGREPGSWWLLRVLKGTSSSKSASFICPKCGLKAYLTDHDIAEDGTVSPSVLCDCGFHDNLKLLEW